MVKLRMRTKLLLSMLLISAGLTGSSFLLVRHSVQAQVRKSIVADLRNSVTTFQLSAGTGIDAVASGGPAG